MRKLFAASTNALEATTRIISAQQNQRADPARRGLDRLSPAAQTLFKWGTYDGTTVTPGTSNPLEPTKAATTFVQYLEQSSSGIRSYLKSDLLKLGCNMAVSHHFAGILYRGDIVSTLQLLPEKLHPLFCAPVHLTGFVEPNDDSIELELQSGNMS